MRVVIAESAWRELCDELDRVAPNEGIVLPLVALRCSGRPSAVKTLVSIDTVIVPRVLRVPAELVESSAVRVSVLPSTDTRMQAEVRRLTALHPRLRVAAYLHSHPFATGVTWPSGGDIFGHMRPLLAQNKESGVETSFSLIACRGYAGGWRLQCFALDEQRVVDLGFTTVIPDADPLITWALQPPLTTTARSIVRQLIRERTRAGSAVQCCELFDGYRRYVVRQRGAVREVIFVPCDYPSAPLQRFEVVS